jgi:hypothetical protein
MEFQKYTQGPLYLPTDVLSEQRTAPESFVGQLYSLDPRLIVTWNRRKHRWVIEECMEHIIEAPTLGHSHLCRRSYVWMVQGEDGSYRPLESSVIEELKGMDVYKKYGGPDGVIRRMQEIDAENQDKQRKDIREEIQARKRDNRRQINEVVTLVERHNIF